MHDHTQRTRRTGGARAIAALAGGAVMRRGVMFLLAHSVFLGLAISLFAAD